MVNPLKTEHAIDWRMTMQEIEDQFQAGMVERDRYREALLEIHDLTRPGNPADWPVIGIIRRALHGHDETTVDA